MFSVGLQIVSDKHNENYTVKVNLPQDLEEAIKAFGVDVVYHRFSNAIVTELREIARRGYRKVKEAGGDEAQCQNGAQLAVDSFTPHASTAEARAERKVAKLVSKMSPEDAQAFLDALKDRLGA